VTACVERTLLAHKKCVNVQHTHLFHSTETRIYFTLPNNTSAFVNSH